MINGRCDVVDELEEIVKLILKLLLNKNCYGPGNAKAGAESARARRRFKYKHINLI
jgi:hypothetical protein